jgi:energy-coupling factor transport system ATP-binding protein
VGTTIILVTHDLSFVACVADSATMLFDGQATCTEALPDFFAQNIFYRPRVDAFMLRWREHQAPLNKGVHAANRSTTTGATTGAAPGKSASEGAHAANRSTTTGNAPTSSISAGDFL